MPAEINVNGPLPGPMEKPDVRVSQTKSDPSDKVSFGLGIEQHDEAILYYFTDVIMPLVEQNFGTISVPVFVGNPEVWQSVRKNGYYRDKESKLLLPVITLRRTRIAKNREIANKLDANRPQVIRLYEGGYTAASPYHAYGGGPSTKAEKKVIAVGVPDYVTLTYEGYVLTHRVPQMNALVEAIQYASDSYWGKPGQFRFMAKIDSFDDATDIIVDQERIIQTRFSIEVNGYLLPQNIQRALNEPPVRTTPTRVKYRTEVISTKKT